MKNIKINLVAQPSIGFNQSGMKSQIDNLYNGLKTDTNISVEKFNIWDIDMPDIAHYFGMGEGMLQVLQRFQSKGSKLVCSPNHWPENLLRDKLLMKINIKNIIYTNRLTKKYLLDKADILVVNSKAEKNMFVSSYNVDPLKVRVIYNSYGDEPLETVSTLFLEKYNIKENYALMVGQVGVIRKNQLPVIKNWKDYYPHLYILGGYEPTPYGKMCMEATNSNNNVTFLGYESDSQIIESAYQNCEIFISPGLIETPSLSAFRALLYGKKVISTNYGGCPVEYFGDNAKYFDPYNETEIVNVIDQVINEEMWGIDYNLIRKFSNKKIIEDYKKLYFEIS